MTDDLPKACVRFEQLDLSQTMLKALHKAGYLEPTPVQAALIPRVLKGLDVASQARTGTGKTAAFAVPILERLEAQGVVGNPQALILTPTRELAVQVRGEVSKLAHGRKVNCVAVYGGKPLRGQIEKLRRGPQVVVGTPGRVLDHIGRSTLDLRHVRFVVLDEADRMLDIGFRPDIERILRRCPRQRQTLLLSATIPPPVQRLARRYMTDPEMLDLSPRELSVETIDQFYFTVDNERKFDLLVRLLTRDQPKQAIIFCRTKRGTDRVGARLRKQVEGVDCIHGDMQQTARDRVMDRFREGRLRYLVATDVVGRGIDVTSISHIINFDTPTFCDDYVHRVGRTGRMGREGVAYTFVAPEEGGELTRIEQRINRLLKRAEMSGFEAVGPKRSLGQPAAEGREPGPPAPAPPPPPPSARRRPVRRYRKAL